jgi:hypothetical protein
MDLCPQELELMSGLNCFDVLMCHFCRMELRWVLILWCAVAGCVNVRMPSVGDRIQTRCQSRFWGWIYARLDKQCGLRSSSSMIAIKNLRQASIRDGPMSSGSRTEDVLEIVMNCKCSVGLVSFNDGRTKVDVADLCSRE